MTSSPVLDILRAPLSRLAERCRLALKRRLYASRLYDLTLGGRHPSGLACRPFETRPGSIETGNELFRGVYHFAGETIVAPNEAPWNVRGGGPHWRRAAHSFSWLNNFDACLGPAAKRQSQLLVRDWLKRHSSWRAEAWEPEATGRRLVAWAAYAPMILDGADLVFRSAFLDSMARQMRHLARAAEDAPLGPARIAAYTGLAIAALALSDRLLERALSGLERTLQKSILADGGPITRNPSDLLVALHDAVMLRDVLIAAKQGAPLGLIKAIDRMAPMIRFFRHGDGGLALFHGAREEEIEAIASLLQRAGAPGKPVRNAVHSGFQRLKAGRMLALMDCGAPAAADIHPGAHASALSFEMSFGRERVIVNCGAPEAPDGKLAEACRTTAAHSTLVVNNTNSSALGSGGGLTGDRDGVTATRREIEGGAAIEAAHEGYRRAFGVRCERRVALADSGLALTGSDRLERKTKGKTLPFDIRFHLHPDVAASLLGDGRAVLLRLPRGAGFRFSADAGSIALEESLYLGQRGEVRRSEQIVVAAELEDAEIIVSWRFTRIAESPRTAASADPPTGDPRESPEEPEQEGPP